MTQINKQSIFKNKLTVFLGFASVLLLLVILMTIAMTRIENNKIQITSITNDLSIIKNIEIMHSASNNRALLLYRMAQATEPFEFGDMYMEFSDNASLFSSNSNKISSKLRRENEIELYKISNNIIQVAVRAQDRIAEEIIEGRTKKAYIDLSNNVIPLEKEISQQLMILTLSLQNNANNSILGISETNDDSNFLIGIIGSFAVLLGLIITFYVTHRVAKTELAFIQQRQFAEQANQAKTLFLATMSHEIRSPLTAIIGFSDILRKENIKTKKSASYVESIHRNGQHLLQVINNILDITKIEAGQLDIEIISTSLFTIIDEFNSTVETDAREKGLGFKINYAFPLPELINTDPVRLKQILFNLSSNAIKFTEQGAINININYDQNTGDLIFDVIDTGIGLTLEQQNKIFNSFTQADSSTTRKYGGSGLGLNICKQLSRKLGGDISVQSRPARGSKFSFTINTGVLSRDSLIYSLNSISLEQKSRCIASNTNTGGHVLLAEDTIDNQNLIEVYVTDVGASISIVNNGAEAVALCEKQQFDLILMDMQMPVMDGIEAIKKIRLSNTTTPIISLTANAMKSDYDKCFNAGANEFLTKPIDITHFNQILYKYLSNVKTPKTVKTNSNKLKTIIEKFLNDLSERVSLINRLLDEKSWTELENETHKLKAIGTPLGFPEITSICDTINLNCRNEELDKLPALVDEFNDFCKIILAKK